MRVVNVEYMVGLLDTPQPVMVQGMYYAFPPTTVKLLVVDQ